jgi:hypothetical protein
LKSKIKNFLRIRNRVLNLTHRILEFDYGHERSRKEKKPVDANGNPLPWFTYPAIDFLSQFDFKNKAIFEYGCGMSTLFWLQREAVVYGVEDNPSWFNEVVKISEGKAHIKLLKEDDYVQAIKSLNLKFDLIVIDGKNREACLYASLDYLNENGILILDNADRHPGLCKSVREKGFIEIDFHGFGPVNDYTWTTSLFFNKFTLLPKSHQPVIPKGGGY